MPSPILVTGATGTIGRPLVAQLAACGADVRAMSSRPGAAVPGAPAVPVVHGDWRDPASLRRACEGVELLFLLLPMAPDKPALAQAALQAARDAGVRHVVHLSSVGADAGSANAFARVQGEIEAAVAASGLAWTMLRPSGFMQNYVTYGADMIRGGGYAAAHGDAQQALVDAADVAACAAAVLSAPAAHVGKVVEPTGARAWTQAEAMAEIARAIGRPVSYLPVDDAAVRAALQGMGMPEPLLGWMVALGGLIRDGLGRRPTDDVQRVTGRAPATFEAFVQAHRGAWQ